MSIIKKTVAFKPAIWCNFDAAWNYLTMQTLTQHEKVLGDSTLEDGIVRITNWSYSQRMTLKTELIRLQCNIGKTVDEEEHERIENKINDN